MRSVKKPFKEGEHFGHYLAKILKIGHHQRRRTRCAQEGGFLLTSARFIIPKGGEELTLERSLSRPPKKGGYCPSLFMKTTVNE
jgi:hypothetical protein